MKTAKQQAQDLDQTNNFLHSLLTTDSKDVKSPATQSDNTSSRMVNGKPKLAKIDSASRFSDPPAPPPQQPLPEKPDLARSSPTDPMMASSLKRSETTRAGSGMGGSPTNQQSSQILSLVEALSSAKKELDSRGAQIKNLEDMLRQERSARESAEERAKKYEQNASFKPTSHVEQESDETGVPGLSAGGVSEEDSSDGTNKQETTKDTPVTGSTASSQDELQLKLNQTLAEMDKMRQDMQKFQQRAESAEADAKSTRESLAEMIERLRQENEEAADLAQREVLPGGSELKPPRTSKNSRYVGATTAIKSLANSHSNMPNGHLRSPSKLPHNLEQAVATVLRTDADGQLLAQSAPYASMLGVVLIGVGLMAYLNGWQKIEK